jgi:hypothetical protein
MTRSDDRHTKRGVWIARLTADSCNRFHRFRPRGVRCWGEIRLRRYVDRDRDHAGLLANFQ